MQETTWQSVWAAIQAMFGWWYVLVPGIVLSLIDVWERAHGKELPIPPRWIIRTIVAGLFVAQILAYADLRQQILSSKPYFVVTVVQSINRYETDTNNSVLLLGVHIVNRGADSHVECCRIHFHSPSLDTYLAVAHLSGQNSIDLGNNFRLDLHDSSYLYNTIGNSLTRGAEVKGRLPVVVPGNRLDEMQDKGTTITVFVKDYLGNDYSGDYLSGTPPSPGLFLLQGETPTDTKSNP
jgi:hypothetical protein